MKSNLDITKLPDNFGVDLKNFEKKKKDFIFGGRTKIASETINPSGNWTYYLPIAEYQKYPLFDTMACVTFSALNCLETLHKFKYNEIINRSDRFTAKMSNTTKNGNTFTRVGDSIRKDGSVDEEVWSGQDILDWAVYYMDILQNIKEQALTWLTGYDIKYEWVVPFKDQLKQALQSAPIQVTVYAWEEPKIINGVEVYQRTTKENNHAVMLFDWNEIGGVIFDHYDETIKQLSDDFFFGYAFKYDINKILEPIKIKDFMMRFLKLPQQSTVYAACNATMTCKAINSGEDYFDLTEDYEWLGIEEVSQEELAKYKLLGTLYAFSRIG